MRLNTRGYLGQTLYVFTKLTELSFDKGKPHNALLIAGIRVILITLEYDAESEVDITTAIFQIGILFKKSQLLSTKHTDQQLLKDVKVTIRAQKVKKRSSSP